ncbi:MAG: AAA family ATPase, partial [Candidatus Electrothrix sp. MAN1_4]|nr:AAA family ATPase [Candidatus Electrothrix sp. MAN1_4]
MKKRILYGIANYAELVEKNGYFVDKTHWLAELELVNNPVFLRPRRFGKSLLCSILNHYYDINTADRFGELFGHTWIGQHPTGKQNSCFILHLNFSVIEPGKTIGAIERSFKVHCNHRIKSMRNTYALLNKMPEMNIDAPVSDNLDILLTYLQEQQLPSLCIIIDEYDNFANQLVTANKDQLYRELTADNGFFKTFFKTLK